MCVCDCRIGVCVLSDRLDPMLRECESSREDCELSYLLCSGGERLSLRCLLLAGLFLLLSAVCSPWTEIVNVVSVAQWHPADFDTKNVSRSPMAVPYRQETHISDAHAWWLLTFVGHWRSKCIHLSLSFLMLKSWLLDVCHIWLLKVSLYSTGL